MTQKWESGSVLMWSKQGSSDNHLPDSQHLTASHIKLPIHCNINSTNARNIWLNPYDTAESSDWGRNLHLLVNEFSALNLTRNTITFKKAVRKYASFWVTVTQSALPFLVRILSNIFFSYTSAWSDKKLYPIKKHFNLIHTVIVYLEFHLCPPPANNMLPSFSSD